MELGGMFKGVPIRGRWTCGISVRFGMSFDALLQGYQAPFVRFDDDRLWLCRIASSIAITNFRGMPATISATTRSTTRH
jgi:hypothetical protein